MEWNSLLNSSRRKEVHNKKIKRNESHDSQRQESPMGCSGQLNLATTVMVDSRVPLERDFDRILFLAPTRRLADKTQVFPLDKNDSVRTRLTHSYEVANLARGMGTRLVYDHPEIFRNYSLTDKIERSIPSLLAAIGLAHDLGNPPFGHQGESAIGNWFELNKNDVFGSDDKYSKDFLNFDGNSQTIRLLTRLQILNDQFGIDLTFASLAALIKYPQSSSLIECENDQYKQWEKNHPKVDRNQNPHVLTWDKHGFFKSEESIIEEIWKETGLQVGIRHPLTYIMEACDDIAYSVLDAEDIVKKGLASFYDLVNHLRQDKSGCHRIARLVNKITNKNEEYSTQELSPAELNELSMQMFRVYAIGELVDGAILAFVKNHESFTSKPFKIKSLMSISDSSALCKTLKKFDKKWGYRNKTVLRLELEGHNYIHKLMDMLWIGIHGRLDESADSQTPFGKYVYEKISENYRRVFEDESNEMTVTYKEAQLLTDAIAGMTDSYLIALHDELLLLYREK